MKSNQQLTVNALGIALYIVLSMAIPVRVVGNYFLCLGYLVMVAYPYLFGAFSGLAVGLLGTLLYCILVSSYNGIVGWVLGNMLIGYGLGVVFTKTRGMKYGRIIDIIAIGVFTALAFLVVKPLTETIMFRIPYALRLASNMPAFLMDTGVMLVGYPIAAYIDRAVVKRDK